MTDLLSVPSPRKRGRPRSTERKSTVSTWVTARQHDSLIKLAHQRGVSVSEVVRSLVMITLPKVTKRA